MWIWVQVPNYSFVNAVYRKESYFSDKKETPPYNLLGKNSDWYNTRSEKGDLTYKQGMK